jgi:site-specific recombinase XerD
MNFKLKNTMPSQTSSIEHQTSIYKYLQSKGLSKSTIKSYSKEILNFITWCDMQNMESENATSADITSYLQHLQIKGQETKTRNINLNVIKHYFNYLIQNETRTDNPARQIKLRGTKTKKLYPIFTKQELESIYSSYKLLEDDNENSNRNWFMNTRLSRKRNKAILSLMIYQGLTTDEVNRLTTQDVKLKEGKIFIAGTRKSNERELELKSHQVMELMEYELRTRKQLLAISNAASNLYFIASLPLKKMELTSNGTLSHQHISTSVNVWKRLSQELKASNKKFINFLQVRSSVITHWLQKYNLREVQYMAGHRYVSTTEGYTLNNIDDLQKDIDSFHPIG